MRHLTNRLYLALVFSLALVTSCKTLDYRGIQSDFNAAVELDNQFAASTTPFVEGPNYVSTIEKLTPEYIAKLDAKLQPNAYLLRSFAQWRSGKLEAARQSALDGSNLAPSRGSRDSILLQLMPALVIDSEMEKRWEDADRKLTKETYDQDDLLRPSYHVSYVTAVGKIAAAAKTVTGSTPAGTLYYLAYQRWRLLQNWEGIIASIGGPDEDIARAARSTARKAAKNAIGAEPFDAAEKSRDSIPAGHPLRSLIVAQGGG